MLMTSRYCHLKTTRTFSTALPVLQNSRDYLNYSKCCILSFRKGKPTILQVSINGSAINSLGPYEHEDYLDLPIGTKTLYRPP